MGKLVIEGTAFPLPPVDDLVSALQRAGGNNTGSLKEGQKVELNWDGQANQNTFEGEIGYDAARWALTWTP